MYMPSAQSVDRSHADAYTSYWHWHICLGAPLNSSLIPGDVVRHTTTKGLSHCCWMPLPSQRTACRLKRASSIIDWRCSLGALCVSFARVLCMHAYRTCSLRGTATQANPQTPLAVVETPSDSESASLHRNVWWCPLSFGSSDDDDASKSIYNIIFSV